MTRAAPPLKLLVPWWSGPGIPQLTFLGLLPYTLAQNTVHLDRRTQFSGFLYIPERTCVGDAHVLQASASWFLHRGVFSLLHRVSL